MSQAQLRHPLRPEPVAAPEAPAPADTSATVLLDANARIREAGATAAGMLGFEPIDMVGRSLVDLAAQGWGEAAGVAASRIRFGATEQFELMLRGRSGRLTLIEMLPHPAAAQGAGPAGFIVTWANRWLSREAAKTGVDIEARRLAQELMQLREEEHSSVARLLEDDLANQLVLARLRIDAARAPEQPGVEELLAQAANSLLAVVSELRAIALALHPRLLADLGLLPTLEWYCRAFQEAHPSLEVLRVLTAPEENIMPALKLEIFRIVQDALSNVVRHAQATAVRLELVEESGQLRLLVEDNGRGFDSADALRCGRMRLGLPSIQRRISATCGRMVLDSVRRRGTRIGAVWALKPANLTPESN